MQKKMELMEETNTDLVARAAELRKDYETLYRQLRGMVYPKSKGDLGEEKDEWRKHREWNVTIVKNISK